MATIEFRWIEAGSPELGKLQAIIEARGWMPLNFNTTRAYCAFDEERLVGFLTLQMIPHAEPLWLDPEYRGSGVAEELAEGMAHFLRDVRARGYLCIAESPYAERLCEAWGMKRVASPVYVMPEAKGVQ